MLQRITRGESEWCAEQRDEPAMYITNRVNKLGDYVDGDQPVSHQEALPATSSLMPIVEASSSWQRGVATKRRARSSSSSSVRPARENTKSDKNTKGGFPEKDEDGYYVYSRSNKELCRLHQRGECGPAKAGNMCPKNPECVAPRARRLSHT